MKPRTAALVAAAMLRSEEELEVAPGDAARCSSRHAVLPHVDGGTTVEREIAPWWIIPLSEPRAD